MIYRATSLTQLLLQINLDIAKYNFQKTNQNHLDAGSISSNTTVVK